MNAMGHKDPVGREPRKAAGVVWRALVGGVIGGGTLAGLVTVPDVLRGLSDPEFRAFYGTWGNSLVAVPIAALVGLICALPAIGAFASGYPRGARIANLFAAMASTAPIIVVGTASNLPLLITFLGGTAAFVIALLAAPHITTRRGCAVISRSPAQNVSYE